MATTYHLIIFTTALFLGCSAENIVPKNVTIADTFQFEKPTEDTRWVFTFEKDLRGLFVFNQYLPLAQGELLSVYWGTDILQGKYSAVNFTYESGVTPTPTPQWQWLSPQMGEAITVIFKKNINNPTVTIPSTTMTPTPSSTLSTMSTTQYTGPTSPHHQFQFLVTVYNETSSLLPNPLFGGEFNYTITSNQIYQIETNSDVSSWYHFYPANNITKLGFALIDATTMSNPNISLTLYRGNSDNLTEIFSNNTYIKRFYNTSDVANYMYKLDFGETLSLYYDYPPTTSEDVKLGYRFLVAPVVDHSSDIPPPYTGSPPTGSTVSQNPPNPSDTTTIPVTPTTTSAAPFIFSIAPIIVTLIFQLCQSF